jgi:hypothetical protein
LDHDKIPALTKIGQDGLKDPNWHTRTMINLLKYDSLNRYIAYGVTWRNEDTWHFHVPYPDHYTVPDFLEFYKDPFTFFESDLPNMYALPKEETENLIVTYPLPPAHSNNKASALSKPDYSIDNWRKRTEATTTTYFAKDIALKKKPNTARLIL